MVPWHVLDVVDNIEDKVETFDYLFLSVLIRLSRSVEIY